MLYTQSPTLIFLAVQVSRWKLQTDSGGIALCLG